MKQSVTLISPPGPMSHGSRNWPSRQSGADIHILSPDIKFHQAGESSPTLLSCHSVHLII